MGRFKSVSRRRKKRNMIIIILLVIIMIVFIFLNIKKDAIRNNTIKSLEYLTGIKISEKVESVFKEDNTPIIYLYSTHPKEKYKYGKISNYNIDYTVVFASYMLSYYLEDKDIYSIVETSSVSEYLSKNNLLYKDSYKTSRKFMEKTFNENPSLEYFFDIHRDSSVYDKTTCEINGVKYAKILFVIGLEHENYNKNLELAMKINNYIKEINSCLSRGIYKKEGKGVDGIYNQDFNEKVTLIELGGQYNSIEEVNNTLKILADVIYKLIKDG